MQWIDLLILAAVAILFGAAVYLTVRRRRNGGCGCGCSGCPYHGNCEKEPPRSKSK